MFQQTKKTSFQHTKKHQPQDMQITGRLSNGPDQNGKDFYYCCVRSCAKYGQEYGKNKNDRYEWETTTSFLGANFGRIHPNTAKRHASCPHYSLIRNNSEWARSCVHQNVCLRDTDSSKNCDVIGETSYSDCPNTRSSIPTMESYVAVKHGETHIFFICSPKKHFCHFLWQRDQKLHFFPPSPHKSP